MHTTTKVCMVIKLHEKKIFTGSTSPPTLAKNFCEMPTCDLFAVANLLCSLGTTYVQITTFQLPSATLCYLSIFHSFTYLHPPKAKQKAHRL